MKERSKKTGGAEALFTAVGTVIGAGFVSGRELLQFFGCFRLPDLCFAGALFFGGFFLFLKLGGKFGGFEGALAGVFGKFAPAVKGILLFGSFVSCAGMLSAADAPQVVTLNTGDRVTITYRPQEDASILEATAVTLVSGSSGTGTVDNPTDPIKINPAPGIGDVITDPGDGGRVELPVEPPPEEVRQ